MSEKEITGLRDHDGGDAHQIKLTHETDLRQASGCIGMAGRLREVSLIFFKLE